MDEKPVAAAGVQYLPVRIPGKGTYTEGNKPFVDFNAVAAGTDPTRQFVHDDRAVANIILGRGIAPPPLTDKGHFHEESAEFWFILLGKIRYNIEGLSVFEADQGDIVQPLCLCLEPLVDPLLRRDILIDVAGLVAQIQYHTVLDRLIILVGVYICAEDLDAFLLVAFQQRCSGEADEHRVGQDFLHRARITTLERFPRCLPLFAEVEWKSRI